MRNPAVPVAAACGLAHKAIYTWPLACQQRTNMPVKGNGPDASVQHPPRATSIGVQDYNNKTTPHTPLQQRKNYHKPSVSKG